MENALVHHATLQEEKKKKPKQILIAKAKNPTKI